MSERLKEAMKKLLEPTTLGSLEVKNRMAMPPMRLCYASETGGVSQRQIDYFVERAKGGVGLIMVGCVSIESKIGKLFSPSPMLYLGDSYTNGYRNLVEAIHEYGTKIAIQLFHPGRQASLESTGGAQPVAPSEMASSLMGLVQIPKARSLSLDEIERLEDAFVEAALRAKSLGFDAVLIDGGAGHLIAQFMSPFTNKRRDEYGGGLEGRMRFPLRIIEKARKRLGDTYPIFFDLSADEFIEGGIRLEDSKAMARILEEAGIKAFRIHGCVYETYQYIAPPAAIPRGVHAHLAKGIREVLKDAKVMLGHRINNPVLAEEILEKEVADIILLGRPLIADPEFPKKVAEGRLEEINKCIACNVGCLSRIFAGKPATCTVNPTVGLEREFRIVPCEKPKKVIVIGGGVGGMETARVAALRGHDVILIEKRERLGGQAILASIAPGKDEVKELILYLETQVRKANVSVRLAKEATVGDIVKERPDVIVLATGAVPNIPSIPGIEESHVVTAWEVLAGRANLGNRVVIIGGGQVGLETADFLAEKRKKVTVLEMLPEVGREMELLTKIFLQERLAKAGVKVQTSANVLEITEEGVRTRKKVIKADGIVIAVGHKPVDGLLESLRGKAEEVYQVGDCIRPRKIIDAIHEGARVGRMI